MFVSVLIFLPMAFVLDTENYRNSGKTYTYHEQKFLREGFVETSQER